MGKLDTDVRRDGSAVEMLHSGTTTANCPHTTKVSPSPHPSVKVKSNARFQPPTNCSVIHASLHTSTWKSCTSVTVVDTPIWQWEMKRKHSYCRNCSSSRERLKDCCRKDISQDVDLYIE